MTASGTAFATVLLVAPVTVKFDKGGVCGELASTVSVGKPEGCHCAWATASPAGESATNGLEAPGLAGADNSEPICLVPRGGHNCGAVAMRDLALAPMLPGALGSGVAVARLLAVALVSELASPGLIGAGAASWDVGESGNELTSSAAGSGGGTTRSCAGSGGVVIATTMLSAGCGAAGATEGSVPSGVLFGTARGPESESVSDLHFGLGAGCGASGTPAIRPVVDVDFAPVLALDCTAACPSA
jgi:hypothetical protein